MYAVCIEFGDRYYRKSFYDLVDCMIWIENVISKVGYDKTTKIWIDKEDVL